MHERNKRTNKIRHETSYVVRSAGLVRRGPCRATRTSTLGNEVAVKSLKPRTATTVRASNPRLVADKPLAISYTLHSRTTGRDRRHSRAVRLLRGAVDRFLLSVPSPLPPRSARSNATASPPETATSTVSTLKPRRRTGKLARVVGRPKSRLVYKIAVRSEPSRSSASRPIKLLETRVVGTVKH